MSLSITQLIQLQLNISKFCKVGNVDNWHYANVERLWEQYKDYIKKLGKKDQYGYIDPEYPYLRFPLNAEDTKVED
jgi:hypothetical protein